MKVFRAILSALLMVLILPWGAYAGTPGLQHSATVIAAPSSPPSVAVMISDAKTSKVTLRKTCRTAILPGSGCSPDHVLLVSGLMITTAASGLLQPQPQNPHWQGRSLAPPRAPPRRF